MKKEKFIKICPKCGSMNIGIVPNGGVGNIGVSLGEYCKDCNYGFPSGARFIPEITESKVDEFRRELSKKH